MTQKDGVTIVKEMIEKFDERSKRVTEFRLVLKDHHIPDLLFYSEVVSRKWLHDKYMQKPFWTNEIEGLYSIEGNFGGVWRII